ncbi:MAG TPA: O-antigen ligase family protein [Candidatus Sulfotelmatobacter sp.]
MPPVLAATLVVAVILTFFVLEREAKARLSWALWLPMAWLLISGSRPVSSWFDMTPVQSAAQYMEGSPLDRVVYTLLLAAGIAVLVKRRKIVARLLRKNWPILLFVFYCAISVTWSDYPGVAFKRWIKSLSDYVMVLIILTDLDREAALRRVLARASFILLPLSVLFIKYYPGLGRGYAEHWEGTQFFIGVADNKNMLGMTCLVFGLAALWRVLHARTGLRRYRNQTLAIHLSLLAMAIWLLLKSNSKTSLACFVATGGLMVAHTFSRTARKRVVVNLLVAAVVLISFSVLFLGIGGGVLQTFGRDSTLTGRTAIWDVLLTVPVNPLVGTGFESFWLGQRLQFLWKFQIVKNITEAHNGYFEVYLNLGWIGVIFLAGLLWTGYRNVLQLLSRDPEAGRLRLGYFVMAVIYNFTEAGIRTTDLVWIAFILAIFALPTPRVARTSPRKKQSSSLALEAAQYA